MGKHGITLNLTLKYLKNQKKKKEKKKEGYHLPNNENLLPI